MVTLGAALALLPLGWKVKLFLAAAGGLLASLFVFLAIATFLVLQRAKSDGPKSDGPKSDDPT